MLVSILWISMFIAYFYAIWLRYLWLIPLILLVWALVYSIWDISLKNRANTLISDYWLFIAWIIIMLWFFLSAKFFGIETINSLLFLTAINIVFFLWSYVFYYEDWKKIAHLWFLLSVLSLLLYVRIVFTPQETFKVFSNILSLYFAIIWFVVFVLGIKYDISQNIKYLFFALFGCMCILVLFKLIPNLYVFLIVIAVLLQILYRCIDYILSHKPPTQQEENDISVRRILAGERILKKQDDWKIKISEKVYDFIVNMPQILKYYLELINTLIILLVIYLYFKRTISLQWSVEQIFYRIIMIWFIANVYALKKIDYTSILQRLVTFLVVNFAIYISLFSIFKWDIEQVAWRWILRNILSTCMVFSIHKTKLWEYLKKVDYVFWIFTTLLALVINIILLLNTPITQSLAFSIILLYVWLQWFMIYYSIKYIKKIKEVNTD